MASLRVISTDTIQATNPGDLSHKIDLTTFDLIFLHIEPMQSSLLFHKPDTNDISNQIQHLKHSLSTTLSFFPPLAGRLIITQHEDNAVSYCIACNNVGALFVHSTAENTSTADILQPNYIPPFVYSFFPLTGVKNHEGVSQPLLAVQVTELVDGIFVAFAVNHMVADGKSLWHFVNSWAEISRGLDKPTKLPSLDRWFLDGLDRPIRFPLTKEEMKLRPPPQLPPPNRIFHFKKEKIAELKSKANLEADTDIISSLQALLTHLWRSVIRYQRSVEFDPMEETRFFVGIDFRRKIIPPLPENYFGNAVTGGHVIMKEMELLMDGGLGKVALEMNKIISLQSQDHIVKCKMESWLKTPFFVGNSSSSGSGRKVFITNGSPRFDVYGNDFGWGKPEAVLSGPTNKSSGAFTLYGGAEEGSVDVQVCLPYEILEAMGNDPEFLDPIKSIH